MAFRGFVKLEDTATGMWQCKDTSNVPTAASGSVTFRVYGPTGTLMNSGTGTATAVDAANITGVYMFSKQATAANGYESGKIYTVFFSATAGGQPRGGEVSFQVD